MSRTFSDEFLRRVSLGKIPGHKVFVIPGRKDSITTTALNDVTETGNIVLPRPAGADLDLVSANANDTAVGTGVQNVHIEYLDSSGDEQTVSVATNGGTVNVGTAIHDVQWVHATAVGSGTVAAGDITLVDNATGATVYEQITAGGNQSLSCRYKVPASKKGYLYAWKSSTVTRKIDMRLRADVDRHNRGLQSGVFNFQDSEVLEQTSGPWTDLPWILCPALSTIKVSGKSFTGTGDASATFAILVIDD